MKFRFYFNNLSIKEKILSFLLVPLILILSYFLFNYFFISDKMDALNQKIANIKHLFRTDKFNSKINNVQILNYIETISHKYDILVLDIKIKKNIASLLAIGKYKNSVNFIFDLEQNNKIKNLQMIKVDDKIKMTLNLEIYVAKNTNIQTINNLPNPFVKQNQDIEQKLILQAIIANNICINNKWYTKGDKVAQYMIEKIFSNYVLLKNGKNILKLEVRKDVQ